MPLSIREVVGNEENSCSTSGSPNEEHECNSSGLEGKDVQIMQSQAK